MGKNLLLLFLFVFLASAVYAAPDIEISEIMYDPSNAITGTAEGTFRCDNDSSCQWIELHNKEDSAVDLASWKMKVNTKTNGNDVYDFNDIVIQPREYIVIATQLGDEDGDGFSFSRLYGNKDVVWDNNADGFKAVDSAIPFIKTRDLGPDNNPSVDIRLLDPNNEEVSIVIFQAHQGFVQKNNGYTMEKDSATGSFVRSLSLGGSPGKKRNVAPAFSDIPDLNLNEDQVLESRLLDFRNFVTDPDNDVDDLVFSLDSFIDPSLPFGLITCGVIGSEENSSKTFFLNCTDLREDSNGEVDVTVSVSDGEISASKDFKIVVNPVNDAPLIVSAPVETAVVGLEYFYDVDAVDTDDAVLNGNVDLDDLDSTEILFSLVKSPSGVAINSSSGEIKWIPAESQLGEHVVEVKARDIVVNSKSSTQEFTIDVKPIFELLNVDVDYSGGNLENVNDSQTLFSVFTASEFSISPSLINRHPAVQGIDTPVEDIELRISVEKDGVKIIDDIIDSGFLLNSLNSLEFDYTFTVPRDLEEGIYALTLEAEGDLVDVDENLRDAIKAQSDKVELLLDVQQARHDVFISNMQVKGKAICGEESDLEITIQNSGTRTERNLILRVSHILLGLDASINIDRINPGENKEQVVTLTNNEGAHNITATVIYNNGQNIASETLENYAPCSKPGDFNLDNCVDDKDVETLRSNLGKKSTDSDFNKKIDIVDNGAIDADDFFMLADLIEPACVPVGSTEEEELPVDDIFGDGFSIDLSQINLLVQQGNSVVSKLKITNNGNNPIITTQKSEGDFIRDEKEIAFDFLGSLSILSSSSRELEIKTIVPEDYELGSYSGTLSIENDKQTSLIPIDIEVFPDICSDGIKGEDISITINEPDRNEDFKPGGVINVELEIRNKGNDRDVTIEGILWNIDKDKEVESVEVDTIGLDKGEKDDEIDFEITVPDDVDNDKIVLYIKAFDDENEESQCAIKSVGLDVDRDKKDVRITGVNVPRILTCESKSSMRVSATNFGKKDDESVFFRITNDDLKILVESERFKLDKFDDRDDSVTKIFSFEIPLIELENSIFNIESVYDGGMEVNSVSEEVGVLCEKKIEQGVTSSIGKGQEGRVDVISGKVIKSTTEKAESDIFVNTAAFFAVILGLGIASYVLKSYIMMRK